MASGNSVPLRQRKHAKTRISLANAGLRLLSNKGWSDISVKELSADAHISEMTFFNYFPKKKELFLYIMRLWSLEIRHRIMSGGKRRGLETIHLIFDMVGDKIHEYPSALDEFRLMAAQDNISIRMCADQCDLTPLEKTLAYPKLDRIADLPATLSFSDIIWENLQQAVKQGELPEKTDLKLAAYSVGVIFHGVSTYGANSKKHDIKASYSGQLQLLWEGLRVRPGGRV